MPRFEAIYEGRRDTALATNARFRRACALHPDASLGRRKDETGVSLDSDKGLGADCRPWLKVERDEKRYEACMAIAEKIGAIDTPKRSFEILKQAIGSEDVEVFGAMYLDTHLRLRGIAETGRGEVDSVMAPIGPTLRLALIEGAQCVLVFHVHPTLYTQPSDSDIELTKSFDAACKTVDLFFVDHLVIGGHQSFYSFADHGYLK